MEFFLVAPLLHTVSGITFYGHLLQLLYYDRHLIVFVIDIKCDAMKKRDMKPDTSKSK